MATTNSESFAQRKHIALATQKMFDLVKKWGVTPFDGIGAPPTDIRTDVTAQVDDNSVDEVYFDDTSTSQKFYLQRRSKSSMSTVVCYQSWYGVGAYHDSSGKLRTDRCFASKKGYIIEGKLYAPDLTPIESRLNSLESVVGTDATKGLQQRVGTLETDNSTNQTNITNLQTTVGGHTTSIASLVASIAKYGVTYFADIVTDETTIENQSVEKATGDTIIYYTPNKRFYLKREEGEGLVKTVKFYENWDEEDKLFYNETTAADAHARTDKFFVSSKGYIIFGELFNPDLSDYVKVDTYNAKIETIEGDIDSLETSVGTDDTKGLRKKVKDLETAKSTIEGNITALQNGKVSFDDLSSRLGVNVHAFKGFEESISGSPLTYSGVVTPDMIYYDKTSKIFYAKVGTTYYSAWNGSSKYNSSGSVVFDALFICKSGYIILGEEFQLNLSDYATKTELQNYQQGVTSSLAGKVDKSAYDTKMSQLDTAIAQRATTAQLATVVQNVNTKANQSDLTTLQNNVTNNYATKAQVQDIAETASAAYNELNARFSGVLTREIVDTLPTSGMKENVIYMLKVSDTSGDYCNEYMWIASDSQYELIGTNRTYLGDYATNAETKRYIAANQGIAIKIGTNTPNVPMSAIRSVEMNINDGDKFKISAFGSVDFIQAMKFKMCFTDTAVPTDDDWSSTMYKIGAEVTASLGSGVTRKYLHIQCLSQPQYDARLFLTNSNYSFVLMTDDDIDQIFNSLT